MANGIFMSLGYLGYPNGQACVGSGDGGARSRIDDLILDDSPLEMASHVPTERDLRHRERMEFEVTEKTRLGGTGLYASKYGKK
jgi:hypothetical protein